MNVLYLCNKRQDGCRGIGCASDCHHTTDIRHAKNFELGLDGVTMVEKAHPLIVFKVPGRIQKFVLQQLRENLILQVSEGVVLCDAMVEPVIFEASDGEIYDVTITKRGEHK